MSEELLLIEQCKHGDPKAQRALYGLYQRLWFTICLRYANDRDDAADMLQNALINIFTKLHLFSPQQGDFKAWSKRVVTNECIMFLRSQKYLKFNTELQDAQLIIDQGETAVEKLSAEELVGILQKLPPGYRVVFNMYVLEGFTHKEIAQALGITEGTSKSQFHKAKELLKRQLELIF